MSDDEGHVEQPEEEEEAPREATPEPVRDVTESSGPTEPSSPPPEGASPFAAAQPVDEDEGRRRMEEARVNRQEKQHQEIAEYEEMRRDQRDKEAEDIKALRERRELRKLERKGEEKRLTELMIQEEARRKAEEEERKRKKNEEERERRETLELKRREAEERLKPKRPNYVIQKKEGATDEPVVPKTFSGDEYQKSKEQMEEEKRAILVQRISELNISNLQTAQLIEKAKELFEHIRKLTGDKYDCDQQFKRQQYDMIELQERARQMNKGKKGVSVVQVDETFSQLLGRFATPMDSLANNDSATSVSVRRDRSLFVDRKKFAANRNMFEKKS